MTTTAPEYGIWVQTSSTSVLRFSSPENKLEITTANRRNGKGLLGLPIELREGIIKFVIEHRDGNSLYPVNDRDAWHLRDDLSCTACDTANSYGRIYDTHRMRRPANVQRARTPEMRKWIEPKPNLPFWACRHRLIPNLQSLRLTSRQLNTEILGWAARVSSGRPLSLFLFDAEQPPQNRTADNCWSRIGVAPYRNLGLLMVSGFSPNNTKIVTTMARLKTLAILLDKRDAPLHVFFGLIWEPNQTSDDWTAFEHLISSYNRPNLSQYQAFASDMGLFGLHFHDSRGNCCSVAFNAIKGYSHLRVRIFQDYLPEIVRCIKNQKVPIGQLVIRIDNYNTSLRKLKKLMRPLRELRVTVSAQVDCLRKGSMLIGSWKKKYARVVDKIVETMMSDVVKSLLVTDPTYRTRLHAVDKDEGDEMSSLEQQLVEVDRSLDMVKWKKRAWAFEYVNWSSDGVERRKMSLMMSRAAAVHTERTRI
ncbi:hypothetical protein FKW77_008651 [Venturia effusa]|uniref:Uncharacterized protein n=1 Tax=Venturia effusa TaxID=50376 RepID=A0A517LBG6_9PEZI|nr:hypothetical protein FKW77_008651 [Venturia effusa]